MATPSTTRPDAARPERWTRLHIVLHWTVAALVLIQLLLGPSMSAYFEDAPGTAADGTGRLAVLHVLAGLLVFVLTAARLWDRRVHGRPPRPTAGPDWSRPLAKWTQYLLYALLLTMPVVGALAFLTGSETLGALHAAGVPLLLAAVALHIAGALAERFWFKSGALQRMLPGAGRRP